MFLFYPSFILRVSPFQCSLPFLQIFTSCPRSFSLTATIIPTIILGFAGGNLWPKSITIVLPDVSNQPMKKTKLSLVWHHSIQKEGSRITSRKESIVTNPCPPACDRPRFSNGSHVAHRTDNSVVTFRNNAGTLSRVGFQPHHGPVRILPARNRINRRISIYRSTRAGNLPRDRR